MHEWRYIAVPGLRERQREGAESSRCRGQAELRGAHSRLQPPHLRLPAPPGCVLATGIALAARGNKEDPFCRPNLNMGCSLCTLQKPEEQYKLLYEVCQVKN